MPSLRVTRETMLIHTRRALTPRTGTPHLAFTDPQNTPERQCFIASDPQKQISMSSVFEVGRIRPNTMSNSQRLRDISSKHLSSFLIDPAHLDIQMVRLTSHTVSMDRSFTAHELCDYGFRYHVLVSCSWDMPDCMEKTLLRRCQEALSKDASDKTRETALRQAFQAFNSWWEPIVRADYIMRTTSTTRLLQRPTMQGDRHPPIVRLRIYTDSQGSVRTTDHSDVLDWPPQTRLRNRWLSLPVFHPLHIIAVGRSTRLGTPVIAHGKNYHLKSLKHALDSECFSYFIDNLMRVRGHRRFVQVAGLVGANDHGSTIDGALHIALQGSFLDQIIASPLRSPVSNRIKEKWMRQITEAMEIGERVGLELSNMAPGDIFIEDQTEDVVVCGMGIPGRAAAGAVRGALPIMRFLRDI